MKIIQFTQKAFLIAMVAFGCIFSSVYALNNEHQTSWLKEEYNEKDVILTSFWKERVINYNKKSVDDFKSFIIAMQYPQDKIFENQMNKLFQNATTHKIEYQSFYNILKNFPLLYFRAMNQAEHLIPEKQYEDINPVIERSDLEKIQHYIKRKDLSVSFTIGSARNPLITPEFPENLSQYPFAIHSVGKVFTGVLTLLMIQNGIISEEALNQPVKLNKSVEQLLPLAIQERLKQITLHQLMTHKSGLGDYLGLYIKAIEDGNIPNIKQAEDFVPFIEEKLYPIGEDHYSNAGILLVGLAIKHAYETKFNKPVNYDDLLQKYILQNVGIKSFSPWRPKNGKYNLMDPVAPYIVGSPAGGYWMTAEDLAKFGQWIYQKMALEPSFKRLVEKYGQEFYHADRQVIVHGGAIPSSSAFLSVSKAGAVIALLSNQPSIISSDLNLMIQEHIFSKEITNNNGRLVRKKQ
jgi:hypothetical protein